MGERLASWVGVVLMTVVLGTSYWYGQSLLVVAVPESLRTGAIDFFAERIALTGFDAAGQPRYRLFAERMTHFGSSDDIDLVMPRVLSMRTDQPQVQASALLAHAQNNGQTLQLSGNVVLTRAADEHRPSLRLQTEELSAVPDDDHFWTDAPVQVQSGRNVLHARGMDFDNVTRHVELRAQVSGVFPPRSRQ